jgi:antitoxin Phd
MKSMAAREAKNRFGEVLDIAQREPVRIEKKGRPVAVVLSTEAYERFEALEEEVWLSRARAAAAEGYLDTRSSEEALSRWLNAPD